MYYLNFRLSWATWLLLPTLQLDDWTTWAVFSFWDIRQLHTENRIGHSVWNAGIRAHIWDRKFAEIVVELLLGMWEVAGSFSEGTSGSSTSSFFVCFANNISRAVKG